MSSGAFIATGVVIGVAILGVAQPRLASPVAGCIRYPLFHTVWVCGGVVYLRHGQLMQYMGQLTDLKRMPQPRRIHG